MSLKKTWFSYVLWAVLVLLTGITTYIAVVKVLAVHPAVAGLLAIGIIGAFVLVHFLCSKIKQLSISKWMGRLLHIVVFMSITAAFIMMRLPAIMDVQNAVSTQQAAWFYDASKVGRDVLGIASMTSILEQVYMNLLSGLFLLLGNKIEILFYVQLILQSLSFAFLIFVGWTLQKRVYAWIPALLYAVSPFVCSAMGDVGPANFWMCMVVFVLFLICMFQNVWKNRNITYVAVVILQILFGVTVYIIKADVLWYGNSSFSTGGYSKGIDGFLGIEMLIAVIILISYCVSFWFNKQDHKTLYIIPFVVNCVILTIAAFYEYETYSLFMMLAAMNLYFLTAESMRVLFAFKPEVVTGSIPMDIIDDETGEIAANEDAGDFDWLEMKEIMNDKAPEETDIKEEALVIDKTAPIENVLPMPKKHKPKVLDYAFEPSEDMMHYDVEIENDEYDY